MMYVGFVARILLASVFLVAAIGKFRYPAAFKETIRRIGVASGLASMAVWLIIVCEAMLVLFFSLGIFPALATIASLLLLLLFIGVSILAMRRQEQIPCNCFGRSTSSLGRQTLIRALFLVVPVVIYYFSTLLSRSNWWPTSFDATISSLSLVAAVILLVRWLLVARSIKALASDLQRINEEAALRRALQDMQQKEAIS